MKTKFLTNIETCTVPDLVDIQRKSFQHLLERGLIEEFNTRNPFVNPERTLELRFYPKHYRLHKPEYSIEKSIQHGKTYSCRIYIPARLMDLETKQKRYQWVFVGNLPLMTKRGHFILNGTPRVIINQLVRSPGIYYQETFDKKRRRKCYADLICQRGTWLRFEFDKKNRAWVRMKKTPKIPATLLILALGLTIPQIINKVDNHSWIFSSMDVSESLKEVWNQYEINYLEKKEAEFTYRNSTQDRALLILAFLFYPKKDISELSPALAKKFLFRKFFNPRTYDLGTLGRLRLNARFRQHIDHSIRTLTPTDILKIFETLAQLERGEQKTDDIDHLKNRRVRASGELIQNQVGVGLLRLEKVVRDRLKRSSFTFIKVDSILTNSTKLPLAKVLEFSLAQKVTQTGCVERTHTFHHLNLRKLITSKPLNTALREFFSSSQLSQFLDQTNPLAEITHKRRFTCLGPGGVNRDTAGMAIRSIHPSHYGRICPIETPEGQNAGLVNSPTIFANLSKTGFLLTPFLKVLNGQVQKQFHYLSAEKEENFYVAPADLKKSIHSFLEPAYIPIRYEQEFGRFPSQQINYVGVSPLQMISLATALVPFLEHDDANRALMGSNMQRQAVPLLTPDRPVVGTGLESRAVMDSGSVLLSETNGYIYSVSGKSVIVIGQTPDLQNMKQSEKSSNSSRKEQLAIESKVQVKVYNLQQYHRSNQDTTLFHRPIVKEGQWVEIGDVIADSSASRNGDLSLGKNIFVAYMPWEGYNFEDAILISERLVHEELYTSIHIEKYTVEAKETKFGFEQITPNVADLSEDTLKTLLPNGLIREGAWVKEGDILVGKSTPIHRKLLSPHEKLLYDVVGKQVPKASNTSLRVPKGVKGRVLAVEVLDLNSNVEGSTKHFENGSFKTRDNLKHANGATLRNLHRLFPKSKVSRLVQKEVGENYYHSKNKWIKHFSSNVPFSSLTKLSALPNMGSNKFQGNPIHGAVQITVYVAQKRKIQVGDKMAGRHGNKGIVSCILPREDMPFLPNGRAVDIVLNPLGVPSRMNVGQVFEALLGFAGFFLQEQYRIFSFDEMFGCEASRGIVYQKLYEARKKTNQSWIFNPNHPGKMKLFDGRTGEPFDQPVMVGQAYMLKLIHLVDEKIHARSTGPYSLVTQQPLRGRSKHGGQRLGEMEVWALEGFGAAYTLQELLTVKSDDIQGRHQVMDAILNSETIDFSTPESFKVLVRELQALCLDINCYGFTDKGHMEPVDMRKLDLAISRLH
nr:RNA polymerase b-subunit [Pedinophyceae sp. YPF-701]